MTFSRTDLVERMTRDGIPDLRVREYSPQEYDKLTERYASFERQEDSSGRTTEPSQQRHRHRKRCL